MLKRYLAGPCAAIFIVGLTVPAAAGPTPAEILKKVQAIVDGAKTYQSTIIVNTNAGKMGTMVMRLDVKTSGKKGALSTSLVGQPTGKLAAQAAMTGSQVVDDGQSTWVYNPAMKSYVKRPSSGKAAGNPVADLSKLTKNVTLSLGAPETIAGKPTFVIKGVSKTTGLGSPDNLTIYVDQATYHLRQMKVSTRTPAMGPEGPVIVLVTMLVQNEKFDVPIPDSAFKFIPPAGAKEMQMGAMMGGPGMRAPGAGSAPHK